MKTEGNKTRSHLLPGTSIAQLVSGLNSRRMLWGTIIRYRKKRWKPITDQP